MSDSTVVSRLLLAWREGDASARDQLLSYVYDELHRLAEGHLRSEDPGHTLQATALIHEAFLRLVDADVQWTSRGHFFAIAARRLHPDADDRCAGGDASGGHDQGAEGELIRPSESPARR